MATWENFPDPIYVLSSDRPGRPLKISAEPDTDAPNPRRDREEPDHVALFGRYDHIGDEIPEKDPAAYLEKLLVGRVEDPAVVSAVAEGKVPGWAGVKSPFGKFPLMVYGGPEGRAWGCTGRSFRGAPADAAGFVRELIEGGREAPSVDLGLSDEALLKSLSGDPTDGLWVCPSSFSEGSPEVLVVDAEDPECAEAVEATGDKQWLYDLCIEAIVGCDSSEPAMGLLRESGIAIRPLWVTDHSGLSVGVGPTDVWDSSEAGWQWIELAETSGDPEWAEGLMDGNLETINQWLAGDVWYCEVTNLFDDEVVSQMGNFYGGEGTGEVALDDMGYSDATEIEEPDTDDPVACALTMAESCVPKDLEPRAEAVVAMAAELVLTSEALWEPFVLDLASIDPDLRSIVRKALVKELSRSQKGDREDRPAVRDRAAVGPDEVKALLHEVGLI